MGIFAILALFSMIQVLGMSGLAIEPGEIFRPDDGIRLEQSDLMDRLAGHRIVLVGETHDDPGHHEVQQQVLTAMVERGGSVALGMEMFPRPMQPQLDQWIAGNLNEDQFLDAVSWYLTWGFDAELYLPLLRMAREHHIPLVALNIDRSVVSQVRTQGLDSLDKDIKETLPVLAEAPPDYRERLQEVFASHPMMSSAGNLDYFIDAQRLWDGVMAQAIGEWLQNHPDSQIVAMVGSGHILMHHGIPHQLASIGLQDDTATLLPWDGQENPVPYHAADFVWGTPPPNPPPAKPRLGVTLETTTDPSQAAIVITTVTPDSPAEKAGLKPGDQPLNLDDQPLPTPHTLMRLLRNPNRNPSPVLTFLRDNRQQTTTINLDSQPDPQAQEEKP